MSTIRCFIVVALITQVLLHSTSAEGIPQIWVFSLEGLDPGFKIEWDPIEFKNDTNPIIGIKIKVWKTPSEIKTINYHYANGTIMKIVESEPLLFNHTILPPEKVFIVKPDAVSLTVSPIEPEVWYHVRVLAFTEKEEGPHSIPTEFKINNRKNKIK